MDCRADTATSLANSQRSPFGPAAGVFQPHGLLFWTIAIPAVAAVYFALAKAGLSMAFMVEQVSLVWPPTGFALACVLFFGYKIWPAIAAGAFLVNATANESLATAAGIAFGNTLEALFGTWMLRRAAFDYGLRHVSDVVKFIVLAVGVSTSVSATVGALSLCLGEAQPWSAFAILWRTWWLGDAIGDLIVAPVLLTWSGWRIAWPPRRWTELILLLAGLSATCFIVFTERWTVRVPGNSLAFAVFPFAIWAALRFGQQGAAVTVALAASLAISGTAHIVQSLSSDLAHERLLVLQLFMGVISVTALLLSAALAERRRALEELQEQREWLHVILTSVGDAVVVADADGRIAFQNPAAQQLFGPTEDVCGKSLAHVVRLLDESTRERADASLLSPRLDRVPNTESRDVLLVRHDGAEIPIDITSAPLRADSGHGKGMVLVFRDNSERRRSERRKDEFLATLAHELRNPLAPISNALHLLRLTDGPTPAAKRMGEIMERQVNHMVRLIDDLLEISRITRGKIELRKGPVDVISVVGSAIETSRPWIEEAGHQFAVSLSREPMTLQADAVRLAQVIANLLNNAAKYTEPGGSIWLSTRKEGSEAVISVRDTGIGIEKEMLPRVFEMFAQVDTTRTRAKGGLGIGLTLARSLVQMHGGRIEIFSRGLGQGSEFVVRLPLAAVTVPLVTPTGMTSSRVSLTSRSIVIVDDAQAALETLAELLAALGQQVRKAADATTALELVREHPPDLVISDIAMPDIDGHELARRIREMPQASAVVLVALSGYGRESDKAQAIEAGFDYHLVKPVTLEAIESLLASLPSPQPPHAERRTTGRGGTSRR